MSECILKATELVKTFGKKNAVDHINLEITRGDICGLLGKNGAGKTTFIRLIVGLATPKSGKIELFGSTSLCKGLRKCGAVIENPVLVPHMTARQNVELQRIALGVEDKSITGELLELVGLSDTGRKKAKNFSLGMKQRLGIALALVGDPEFLFLDEPINGLDPVGIKDIRDLILKLNRELGITVMISSHIISELTKIVTRYGVISEGKMVDEFTAEELSERVRDSLKLRVDEVDKSLIVIKEELGISDAKKDYSGNVLIYGATGREKEIKEALESREITVYSISAEEGDYEKYFIELMEGGTKRV